MRTRAFSACLLTGAVVLIGAPAALAAPTATTFVGGTLTVTGDATAETYTVLTTGAQAQVTGPGAAIDPDGAGPCAAAGGVVTCPGTTAVVVNGAAGGDTLSLDGASTGNQPVDLNGGDDVDTLTANDVAPFRVSLDGGAGNDILNAGTGALSGTSDTGGAGDDTFNGSAQLADTFRGEPGSDFYHGGTRTPEANDFLGDPPRFQFDNGASDGISYAARTDALNVSLDNVANDGSAGEGDNVGSDVDLVVGGSGSDTFVAGAAAADLIGNAGNDTLIGGASDDRLLGGDGSDALFGSTGDDTLNDGDFTPVVPDPAQAAPGNDNLDGGPGNDTLESDQGADNLVGGPGTDSAAFGRFIQQAASVTTPPKEQGITVILDDVANDGVTASGEGDNVHSDVENISTSDGADTLIGSAGAETFNSFGGNDGIAPGGGADIVNAGDGDDTINAVDQTTDIVNCGRGNDGALVDLAGFQPLRADVTLDCETLGGQAFGAVAPVVDTSKPTLKLSSKTVKSAAFRKDGTLRIKVTCSKACAVSGEAFTTKARITTRVVSKVGQLKVGAGRLNLGTGTRTLKVKIAKKYLTTYKRALRTKAQRRKGLTFTVSVTASDALGIQAASTRTIKVKG